MPTNTTTFDSVIFPSIFRRRNWAVVEQMKQLDPHKWIVSVCAVGTMLVILATVVFNGGLSFGGSAQIANQMTEQNNQLRKQLDDNAGAWQRRVDDLSRQITSLSSKVDQGPRADQIVSLDRALGNIDGRVSALDNRVRIIEEHQAAQAVRLDSIDAASRAVLPGQQRRP